MQCIHLIHFFMYLSIDFLTVIVYYFVYNHITYAARKTASIAGLTFHPLLKEYPMYEEVKNKKDIVMDLSDTETTARICRALSSETRLEILKCLVAKAMTISELAEAFYLPMSSMCLHIKTLKEPI